jgi:hypothetical protein
MPLTDRVLSVVINALECVDIGPKRRRAFDALRPLLNLKCFKAAGMDPNTS